MKMKKIINNVCIKEVAQCVLRHLEEKRYEVNNKYLIKRYIYIYLLKYFIKRVIYE